MNARLKKFFRSPHNLSETVPLSTQESTSPSPKRRKQAVTHRSPLTTPTQMAGRLVAPAAAAQAIETSSPQPPPIISVRSDPCEHLRDSYVVGHCQCDRCHHCHSADTPCPDPDGATQFPYHLYSNLMKLNPPKPHPLYRHPPDYTQTSHQPPRTSRRKNRPGFHTRQQRQFARAKIAEVFP